MNFNTLNEIAESVRRGNTGTDEDCQGLVEECEAYRRETKTGDTTPLQGVVDYSTAAQRVDTAMHHLNEALPAGQIQRTRAAYALLMIGTLQLGLWLGAVGWLE